MAIFPDCTSFHAALLHFPNKQIVMGLYEHLYGLGDENPCYLGVPACDYLCVRVR